MIKIDLGRDSEDRAKAKKKPQAQKGPKKSRASNFRVPDIWGTVLVLGAFAFAFLPHLFVEQYKQTTREKHEAARAALSEAKAEAQRDIDKYKSYQVELDNFEKQSALIRERLNAVNELLSMRNGVVNLLDAIGQSLPNRTWLTKIDLKNGNPPTMMFTGSAYSNEDITDFSDKLTASVYLDKVTLEEVISKSGEKGEDAKSFTISAEPKIFSRNVKGDRKTAAK